MNDEEVVVPSEEQSSTQENEQSAPRRRTLSERAEQVRDDINSVGKTVENFGKGEEKVADWMDGGNKVTKATSDVGSATSSAADAGAKAMKASGKATEAAGKATEAAGKATEAAGKATEAAGEGIKAGGKGVEAAGQGVSAAGSTPYTAALKPVGEVMKAGGKGTQAAGEGVKATGKAEQAAGKAEQAAGKAEQAAGKAQQASAEAADTAAKTGKAASGAAKKASDNTLADKLRKNGKLNQARGKRLQDLSEKFDADKYMDKATENLGKLGKVIKGVLKLFDPKVIAVILLLVITLGTLLVSYVLSPMFYMSILKDTVGNPDNVEKFNNYISGLGFKNSEQAFYDEVNYLNTRYNKELDFPYIMSALYYTDIYYGDTGYYTQDVSNTCSYLDMTNEDNKKLCGAIQIGIQSAQWYLKEAQTTTGSDGLVYSANKLYRLRNLAKHQFLGSKSVETTTLDEYLEMCIGKMDNEMKKLMNYFPLIIAYAVSHAMGIGVVFDNIFLVGNQGEMLTDVIKLFEGTESWKSISIYFEEGKYDSGFTTAITNFVTQFFDSFLNIKSISFNTDFSLSSLFAVNDDNKLVDDDGDEVTTGSLFTAIFKMFNVEYYKDTYDAEKYEEYLVKEYIPNMPEFSKLLVDKNGNKLTGEALEKQVNQIASEIKQTKDLFDSIYQTEESAQKYGECIGDIDLDLLRELNTPVDLQVGQTVTFASQDNYGLIKGVIHNGVDLNEASVGVTEGANVYALYDGKVAKSTVDGTYDDKTVTGGWVAIDYIVQYTNSNVGEGLISKLFKNKLSKIRVFYGGLNTSDLKLKSGDIVSKGDIIGHIGSAAQSENGDKPSLHFGVYDLKNSTFLNPVNMFITCETNGGLCVYDSSGGLIQEIPKSVLEYNQINYTVTCYNKVGWVMSCINPKLIGSSSLQYKVHEIWNQNGSKYKNGIAVLNVNGVDRYFVATTSRFGKAGDIINANLENGDVIPMIIADIKAYKDTGATNASACNTSLTDPGCFGHLSGGKLSVLEFEVDPEKYNSSGHNPASWGQEWDTKSKVKSITRYGSILENSSNDGTCEISGDPTSTTTPSTTTESAKPGTTTLSCNSYTSKGEKACNNATVSDYKCTWVNIPGGSNGYCKEGEKIKRTCTQFGLDKGLACPKVDDYDNACIETKPSGNSKPGCGYNKNAKKCEDYTINGASGCSGKTDDYGKKCIWKNNNACVSQ